MRSRLLSHITMILLVLSSGIVKALTLEVVQTAEDSCRTISDTIKKLLLQDLAGDSHTLTVDFLEAHLDSPMLASHYSASIRRSRRTCLGLTLHYQSSPLLELLHRPHVYPFLPGRDTSIATLASYRTVSDASIATLPDEIREFVIRETGNSKSVFRKNNVIGDTTLFFSRKDLQSNFPKLSKQEFVIFSDEKRTVSRISTLQFGLWEFGPNQILASFEKTPQRAVMAAPISDPDVVPESVLPVEPQKATLFPGQSIVSEYQLPNTDFVFVASDADAPASIRGLWDGWKSIWYELEVQFGNDYGAEFTHNYILDYGEVLMMLRIASNYAEIDQLGGGGCATFIVADETAPEVD